MRIAISTLGCKVNYYDSAAMGEVLDKEGYQLVPFTNTADIYIINTCTVTEKTDAQSRQLIRRALKSNPHAQVIVTGCYAQHAQETIAALSDRVHVLGNAEKVSLQHHVKQIIDNKSRLIAVSNIAHEKKFNTPPLPHFLNRTRAFLKIQDGCSANCSYCVVPSVRGPNRSLALNEVLTRLRFLAQAGYREIVLTGIHLGVYGQDLYPEIRFTDLLHNIVTDVNLSSIRLRLSSIEPIEFSDELIQILAHSSMVCPHLQIPLQSGDEEIIKKMNRTYTPLFFKNLIERLLSSIPDVNIGLDVVAGFPGEADQHFENTLNIIRELSIGYLHVFPFSRRPGTPAALLAHQVPENIKKSRAEILREESFHKKKQFYASFRNKTLSMLVEGKRDRKTGLLRGFSRNYIPIFIAGPDELIGKEIPVRINDVKDTAVFGELYDP